MIGPATNLQCTTLSELRLEVGTTRPEASLDEDKMHRLMSAFEKRVLAELDEREHDQLSAVAATAFEVQRQRLSLDPNGLRFLITVRSRAKSGRIELSTNAGELAMGYRAMVWAFFSEHQDVLVSECHRICAPGFTWERAKTLGIFFWLTNRDVLVQQLEAVGRTHFNQIGTDDRDPIFVSLLYLAVRKRHLLSTFWKQSFGHPDQKTMLKFLQNDFEEARWRSAALKNAYALMSKRRFLFAAAFFLLGDSLRDAVNVCVRQLKDIDLAVAIARAYEPDNGECFQSLLQDVIVPLAFEIGSRWLAIWAFWKLNRRDLAVRATITPLPRLALALEPPFTGQVSSPAFEDPCLIYMFAQLRSWSLQTVKGAVAIQGQTEFNVESRVCNVLKLARLKALFSPFTQFVLHAARTLRKMGCHTLGLSLVATYQFSLNAESKRSVPQIESGMSFNRRRGTLRRRSTLLDMEVPSNLASRAPSPTPNGSTTNTADSRGGADDARNGVDHEKLHGASEFHQVLRKVKVETKAPPEFDLGAFGF
ncbi:regulator of (H+)-ATPase in vacuolar membrane [Microbotryomycetes sp. JL221]|nr:regulator of (H+)-ATPase in vacuolar membrane [Microbotryomycetes sp. JL221]